MLINDGVGFGDGDDDEEEMDWGWLTQRKVSVQKR